MPVNQTVCKLQTCVVNYRQGCKLQQVWPIMEQQYKLKYKNLIQMRQSHKVQIPLNNTKQRPAFGNLAILAVLILLAVVSMWYHSFRDGRGGSGPQVKHALIGDIGGTNIRYQLVELSIEEELPLRILKKQEVKVRNYASFQQSVQEFLQNVTLSEYPCVAVIAIAGPVDQNSAIMSNVPKWGKLEGTAMGLQFNISQFRFVNDFQSVSYGLTIIEDSELVTLNNRSIDESKRRGVIGAGTGLGHSIILGGEFRPQGEIIVLPSQSGHTDMPLIDEQTVQYYMFLKQKLHTQHVDLQQSFCGPSIPFLYQFYAAKLNHTSSLQYMTSERILQECIRQNPAPVFIKVYSLFIKLYSSAIANFMIQHMTLGGVYIVGGLTKTLLPKLLNQDILGQWKARHPQMKDVVEKMPLVFCKQVELGLRGALVLAKQLSRKHKDRSPYNQDIF